ncbi:MAG: serine hydrolase [Bacteroidales bacterium]|jgi:CubicO group peptidase (beta-lactamase class C family)|nr:serine hydrolase [Bacteroidales bacterium]
MNKYTFRLFIFLPLASLLLSQCSLSHKVKKHPEKMIHGYVSPGFEEVREEYIRNYTQRKENGSAITIYYKGEKVVDLWGGYRDALTKSKWEEGTKVIVFSTTKGLAAICLAMAHSNGWLDYEEKVSTYWPEFAQNGKENITVRQLLAHEAGLCLVDEVFEIDDLADFDYIAELMARQKPLWNPGEMHGYHLSTMGMYINELMRRVDPKGRSIGVFFDEELAKPLDLDFYIGLPDSIPDEDLAKVYYPSIMQIIFNMNKMPEKMRKDFRDKKSILYQSFKIPEKFSPNSRSTQRVEMPSGNGIGDARSIAKVYSVFAQGAKELGLKKGTIDLLSQEASVPPNGAFDIVMGLDTYFSFGFIKPGPDLLYGDNQTVFGTPGAGGSFGFADPQNEIGYAYVMSKMGLYLVNDPREVALREAMYRCVERIENKN